jgi:putative FmdB family regulatory protein
MPIYEYECAACSHVFEEWQKMADSPVRVCPKCKKHKVNRLISHTSFQLKGGGWYKDLYSSARPASGASDTDSKTSKGGDDKGSAGQGSGQGSDAKETASTAPAPKTTAKDPKTTPKTPAPAKKATASSGSRQASA